VLDGAPVEVRQYTTRRPQHLCEGTTGECEPGLLGSFFVVPAGALGSAVYEQ
jgi:hypothetical protein